jgi:hypothetical protein
VPLTISPALPDGPSSCIENARIAAIIIANSGMYLTSAAEDKGDRRGGHEQQHNGGLAQPQRVSPASVEQCPRNDIPPELEQVLHTGGVEEIYGHEEGSDNKSPEVTVWGTELRSRRKSQGLGCGQGTRARTR